MIDYRFLIRLFLKRLHVLLLVALPVAAAGAWVAFSLPPRFEARALLLVEAPQVPEDLAASTLRQGPFVLLGIIRDRVLARDNLLDLSREFRLHVNEPGLSPDEIVSDMRRRISIVLPRANVRETSGTFTVRFEAAQAPVSAAVTNALVDQILRENASLRAAAATQTLAFFDEELSRLDEELARQTARILAFQQANRNALPDSLNFRRSRQTSQQERLLQVQREISSLSERRERMVEMFDRTGRVDGQMAARSPEERELQGLRRELSRALRVFSPQNPRLRTLQAEVEALESVVAEQLGTSTEQGAEVSLFDVQLADIDAQLDFLASQREMIEGELDELAASIEATAANAAELSTLERDLQNLQSQYNSAVSRRAQARVGERIEAQAQGVRISVIEAAVPPSAPNRPNRRAITMAGIGGGLGLGVLVVALLMATNRAVLRPVEITQRLGVTPFGTIPLYRTRRQILRRRAALGAFAVLLLTAVPAGLWWVDQYYLPLDLVLARLGAMTGLDGLRNMLPGASG